MAYGGGGAWRALGRGVRGIVGDPLSRVSGGEPERGDLAVLASEGMNQLVPRAQRPFDPDADIEVGRDRFPLDHGYAPTGALIPDPDAPEPGMDAEVPAGLRTHQAHPTIELPTERTAGGA